MNPKPTDAEDFEAQRLYYALFKKPAPELTRLRFIAASQSVFASVHPQEKAIYETALKNVSDLEALEIAARRTKRLPLLSAKMALIIYLAETLPDHQHYFVNERTSFLSGLCAIIKGAMKTGLKFVKGLYLLRTFKNA